MRNEFRRVAILDRGEPALRCIRAVREFNRDHGLSIETVALHAASDRGARFVQEADLAADLGEGPGVYQDLERLERGLAESDADAAWVGWGFVAESPELIDRCQRLGITFIGPSAAAMRVVADKLSAKQLARHLGIPVVPWARAAAPSVEVALGDARSLGFPVVVKAVVGRGGRAVQRVEGEHQLPEAFARAREEAARVFSRADVFVERWVSRARHVEVQVVADSHGTAWAIGTRDCSVQRRRQKVLEEAPAAGISTALDAALREDALKFCRGAGYVGVGSVEFLLDPGSGQHYFMEMSARQQVEHAVTELTTGLDLVTLQLQLARGDRLSGRPPSTTGHAIEVRLNAEDPDAGFAPAPGRVARLRVAPRAGLRLDAVGEGDAVSPEYDSMFAKLVAHGRTRQEALDTLAAGLADASVLVEGGGSNRAFLLHLVRQEAVREGTVDVEWLDRLAAADLHVSREHADVAIVQAAVEACDARLQAERDEFLATAARQRPVIGPGVGRTFELRYRGQVYQTQVLRQGPTHYQVVMDGVRIDASVERTGPAERLLLYAGLKYRTQSVVRNATHIVEVDDSVHRVARDEAGIVRAFAPAVVVAVRARPGMQVNAGDPLLVLEAMKMETPILASAPGVVRDVFVLPNAHVAPGTPLARVDHVRPTKEEAEASRVLFRGDPPRPLPGAGGGWRLRARAVVAGLRAFVDALAPPDVERGRNLLADLRELVLGSEITPADAARLLSEYRGLAERLPPADPVTLRLEDSILETFVHVSRLFERQAASDDPNEPTALSSGQYLLTYLRTLEARGAGLPADFVAQLRRALALFGSDSLEVTDELKTRLFWLYRSHLRFAEQAAVAQAILERRVRHAPELADTATDAFAALLEQLSAVAADGAPALVDLARELHYRFYLQPSFERGKQAVYDEIETHLASLTGDGRAEDRDVHIEALVACPHPLSRFLSGRFEDAAPALRDVMLEVLTRRCYRARRMEWVEPGRVRDRSVLVADYARDGAPSVRLAATHAALDELGPALGSLRDVFAQAPGDHDLALDLYLAGVGTTDPDETSRLLLDGLAAAEWHRPLHRIVVGVAGTTADWTGSGTMHFTFRWRAGRLEEDLVFRGLHPEVGERLEFGRLRRFRTTRIPSADDLYVFHGVACDNPRDERLFALGEVGDMTVVRDDRGSVVQMPQLERMVIEGFTSMREFLLRRAPEERLLWNRLVFHARKPFALSRRELMEMGRRLAPYADGLGFEKLTLVGPMPDPDTGQVRRLVLNILNPSGRGLRFKYVEPHDRAVEPLTEYETKVVRMRQRGLTYPYEVVRLLTPDPSRSDADLPPGEFLEHDLDAHGELVPVARPYGQNSANIVVGIIRNFTEKYPEGMARVILLGDPSREMGSLAEPECRRIIAAMDLATSLRAPLEWFALSAGAKISMRSGTENMDWIARVLRRIVLFTQAGGEINIVVTGINVGAQPYWNAEATMLMHTRGLLVMMPESAMVLTGKTALDYSGSVSAEDNIGIGGYERVMGPNGQAQYWAHDLHEASHILLRYYAHTYVAPGERFPRRARTTDPVARDVCSFAHGRIGPADFATVGDAFSNEANPGRKRPFDIRRVMLAVSDQDHAPLERWARMLDAEVAVVWDAHIGGYPVCLLGFDSKPLPRLGFVPTDGPDQWTSGTLFPMGSKKTARAINAASGNRPLVVVANLSGFDGSPESMRRRQLEFGAEIGRAVVNFRGPIVFCVVSRYHGGAFVVFSKTLNDNLEVAALEGTYASVIGGAPAAAVVFAREVDQRTRNDPRVVELERDLAAADEAGKRRLRPRLAAVTRAVRSEKLGEVADEFDHVHSVHRALAVGSLDRIIPPHELRPYLVDAIERGMAREAARPPAAEVTSDV